MWEEIKNYFANFDGATNICRTVALWITVALAVSFAVTKLYVFILGKASKQYDADTLAKVNRIINSAWIAVALVVALGFIVTFSACYFVGVAKGDEVLVPILFYPLLVLVITIVASAAALFFKPFKLTKIVCAAVSGAAFVAAIICMIVYYASGDAGEAFSNIGLYISAIALTAAIIAFAIIADRGRGTFDTRTITFAAICVALSFALSYVRLFKMPMGGSITFASMLPLMLFAFMFGCRKGVLVGLVYGVLQAVQDPWIIHPAQFMLDYAVAFVAIGLTGCLRDLGLFKGKMRVQFVLGAVVACALRFVGHYLAGVFAFGAYGEYYAAEYNMPALSNAYLYSFVYQCMYLIPELAIVLAVSMIIFASKSFRRQVEIYSEKRLVRGEPATASVEQTDGGAVEPVAVGCASENVEPTASDGAASDVGLN